MKLALVIPTRGVIFARTIQSTILSPELPPDTQVFIVSGKKIPDSHNECARLALEAGASHIWFVEEDMEIPTGVLSRILDRAAAGAPYVAVDYPITEKVRLTCWYENGQPLWTGFGCTLIAREVFEKFTYPYFTTEWEVWITHTNPLRYEIKKCLNPDKVYGHFDIWFGFECRKKGIPIEVLPDVRCNHLRLKSWERKSNTNNGAHEVYEL